MTSLVDVEHDPDIVNHLRTDKWIENAKSLPRYKGLFEQQNWFRDFKGKSQKFMLGETEAEFETRKRNPIQFNLLKKLGWLDREIWYHLEANGFRTDNSVKDYNDYKGQKNVIWIGCSNTFALGVDLEDSYSYKLHKRIHSDSNYVNLSVSGKGIETWYRFLKYWIPVLRPSHVYIQHIWVSSRTDFWQPIWREFNSAKPMPPKPESIVNNDNKLDDLSNPLNPTPWFIAHKYYPEYVPHRNWEKSLELTTQSLFDPQPSLLRLVATLDALKHLFWKYKVKGYIFPMTLDAVLKGFQFVDHARDLSHPGIKTHTKWVDHYNDVINNYDKYDLYGMSEVWRD